MMLEREKRSSRDRHSHNFLTLMEFDPYEIHRGFGGAGSAIRGSGTAVMLDALKTANSTAAQVLDESVLNALGQLQGKARPDFVNQVIIIFLETALALLTDLKNGSASGQVAMLHHASHALKGCSATIGAATLSALCAELETVARAGAVPDAPTRVDAIVKEYRRVEAALISRLAKRSEASRAQREPSAAPQPTEQS
jgi:HPt (histidine-containing phosphotransfer) domain-containing protein